MLSIPKEFLEGVEEVEISAENGLILVRPSTETDPILELGKHPVVCSVTNASENHDAYLYRLSIVRNQFFLDTGYLIALEAADDQHHESALKHWHNLI